ncbi:MAG: c-type cytochrome [Kofleriaceae bacterium]
MLVLPALAVVGVIYSDRSSSTPTPTPTATAPPPAVPPTPLMKLMASIPEGPAGDAIRRGSQIVEKTFETLPDHVGNGLHCTSCHLGGGTVAGAGPWIGLPAVFPEYRARSGKADPLSRRINDCFERSMNGKALDPNGAEMAAILAYIDFISRDAPGGKPPPGRGFKRIESPPTPDRQAGAEKYATRCASCHGANGAGLVTNGAYTFPPLWGDRSFNIGAGMARLDTAAAFIHGNMPLGAGGTLSEQDAYDIADFMVYQPRPDFPGKVNDWPKGGKPRDARY